MYCLPNRTLSLNSFGYFLLHEPQNDLSSFAQTVKLSMVASSLKSIHNFSIMLPVHVVVFNQPIQIDTTSMH
jgi:hypothetical protein